MTTQLAAQVATLKRMVEEQRENLQGKIAADSTMLTAIGETQSKHGLQLTVIEGKIDQLGRGQETLQADMGMVKGRLGKVEDKLTVIAKTQAEHTKAIAGLESRMTGVETRLTGVETRLTGVETRLDGVETRLTRVEESLGTVNGKLDQIIDRLK
jgi:chromosome segregation ATPase